MRTRPGSSLLPSVAARSVPGAGRPAIRGHTDPGYEESLIQSPDTTGRHPGGAMNDAPARTGTAIRCRPPRERADALAGLDGLVLALDRRSAEGTAAHDARLLVGPRARSQSTGRRLSGSTRVSDRARRPGRCPARRGTVSLSSVCAERDLLARAARTRSTKRSNARAPAAARDVLRRAARTPRPARASSSVTLALAQRLLEVLVEPLARQRPRADDASAARGTRRSGRTPPAPRRAHERRPLVRHPGQRDEPRAHVARALRVVRLRGEQVQREAPRRSRLPRGTRRPAARTGRGRRRPRSARAGGSSGRTPCPRRPSPSPAAVVCWKRVTNSSWPRSSSSSDRARSSGGSRAARRASRSARRPARSGST